MASGLSISFCTHPTRRGCRWTFAANDVDVCYPGEEQHADRHLHQPGDSRLQLLTYVAKHARIRGLILELRNKAMA